MKAIIDLLKEVSDEGKRNVLVNLYNNIIGPEFDTKPAGVSHHHTKKGDMGRHVMEVMNIAVDTFTNHPEWYKCTLDDVIISSFVHDFNKIGRYKELEPSHWKRQPKYGGKEFDYDVPEVYVGEAAEVMLFCARNGLILTDIQANAVVFHHGFVAESARDNPKAMSQMTGLSVLLHFADMMSVKAMDCK